MSKEAQRKWRGKNPDYEKERKAYKKEWFQKNKARILKQQEKYRKKNPEKVAVFLKRYREKHKKELAVGQRRYYQANRERLLKYYKEWYRRKKGHQKGQRNLNREGKSG